MAGRAPPGLEPVKSRLRASGVLAILFALLLPQAAVAVPAWAPVDQATIRPGAQALSPLQAQCSTNFVFYDGDGIYLGLAAHCVTDGQAPEVGPPPAGRSDGCLNRSLPLETPVLVAGATRPATLAYSSWITMQEVGESDPNVCSANDFALLRLDPADHVLVNPTFPRWGGPTGLAGAPAPGDIVMTYGSSSLRLGLEQLVGPMFGLSRGQSRGGWSHTVLTVTPGISGDSGSGYIDAQGRAFGVLSTLILLPRTAHNGVGDLSRQLEYMRSHSALTDVELALGTEPFEPDPVTQLPGELLETLLNLTDLPLRLLVGLLS